MMLALLIYKIMLVVCEGLYGKIRISYPMITKRLTLSWTRKMPGDINAELQWLCDSLGLFPLRDYNSSMYRLFIELIKDSRRGTYATSDELAYRVGLTRGTVIHHLNKLMAAGIVMRQHKYYVLKDRTVARVIRTVRADVNELFDELEQAAEKIDKML